MLKGIDVSHHQKVNDWNAVKNDGISFVFLKATEGNNYIDPTFSSYCAGARAVGLEVGAYHFARFANKQDAILEAQFFLQTTKGADLTLPLVLDIETNDNNLSKATLTECVNAFCDTIQATGQKVMVYTYKSFMANFDVPTDTLFWFARYGVNSPDVKTDFWQYSENGRVAGISSGDVDMNYFMGDVLPTIDGKVSAVHLDTKAPTSESAPVQPAPNTNVSLVDYLVSIGQDASFANRQKLAQQYGVANYNGTADQNTQLLAKLKAPPGLPNVVLRRGDKGENVKALQEALNKLHFNCGTPDGFFGTKTLDAVKRFQMVHDAYHVDGIYGARTRGAMVKLL
jgi:GH25 family lysozyme M1 (1,4-beta-N-acetylmuramidase)